MTEQTIATTEQQPPATDGQQPNAQPQTPGDATGTNGGQSEEKQFSQAQLDAIVKDRLDRERKAAEAKAAKAAEEAEATKLKEQAQWQKLAEDKEAKVKELEPQVESLTAERDQLREIVTAVIETETKDWPKEVKDLLPDQGSDILTRYAAVNRTRPLAQKLATQGATPGNGPNPRPNGAAGAEQGRERQQAFYSGKM